MKNHAKWFILPGLLAGLLLYLLISWGYQQYTRRPLTGRLTITDPALSSGIHAFNAGSFTIQTTATGQDHPGGYQGPRIVITYQDDPGKWLWHSLRGQAFVAAAQGRETVKEKRGSFSISDRLIFQCTDQTIDEIREEDNQVVITGSLRCGSQRSTGYHLTFQPVEERQLAFQLTLDDPDINRAYLTYASDSDEHIFGFGEQFSFFDHKGRFVPIWVSEQGIGRGLQPVTFLVDLVANSGGNPYTTYAAVPHYISSRLRSLFLENSEYSQFDLRSPDKIQVEVFASTLAGRILYGKTPADLITEYTRWAGRMRPLPDWILSGAVIGMQGGTERVREVYQELKQRQTPISAFWLQDWVGQRTTSFGKQLWWNWELDETRYPGWDELRDDLAKDNIRFMVYASPFLTDVSAKPGVKRNLFQEAVEAGYLVKDELGRPYLVQNTDFSAGMVDLTNPQAWAWYKSVLKDELVVAAGASGWMADFGEALPYDARLSDNSTGGEFHNRYPEAWAQLNRELIDELPNGNEMVFFQRAGFQHSPNYSTLFWSGDQLVTWDQYDGIKSAVTGILSGGISGFSLNHSDIGGYTAINNPLLKIHRSKELLLRWMELSALSTVYRTHEGNQPDENAQFYSDQESLEHFDRMARVYLAWKHIRVKLVEEAASTGLPVMRHLFFHYPDDLRVYTFSFQEYMLGSEILVAPVLDPNKDSVEVYLPPGNWIHIWSGIAYRNPYRGQWVTVPAPLGQPAIFYLEGSQDGAQFRLNLIHAGLAE